MDYSLIKRKHQFCEGVRVALTLNIPIITRYKNNETASKFLDLDRLRQAVIPNETKFKNYI